ncbi:MAG: thrombospondin type 3 repeat-containing protein [Planctomycetes bacterium]|nr:thrombospondin type 3 repeat-containing protein [Planctomycetota bacterium]
MDMKKDSAQSRRLVCALTASLVVALAGVVTPASAATLTVTNTNDAGAGSLRDAITQANGAAGADVIDFAAALTGTIALGSDLPTITEELTIAGPGPRVISISGGNARRILNAEAKLTISGLRLANGFTDRGGGIRFAIANQLLKVFDCHFDQCLALNEGGAICIIDGSIEVERVTFTTDQAAGSGGCIWYGQGTGSPTAKITNCTFVNNFASQQGGAIRQFDATAFTSEITNCTFVVNNAGNNGGAIAVAGGTMTLRNSLFTANGAGGNPGGHIGTVAGTTTSLGHNLFGHLDGANFAPDATDKFGTVPAQLNTGILIAFPFNNGGLTDTLPPVNNTSILIDGGDPVGGPVADQRGFGRVGCAPDVGAFEVQTVTDTDGDGVINCLDLCPNTPACASVNETGCPTDGDADGVFDGCDLCAATSAGDAVDASGCSTVDEDADGVLNDVDDCRGTPPCAIASVDAAGCPADADADGLFDGCDNCPGADDLTDTDGDGIPDCLDACPAVGDSDADGVQDCQDGCPADPLKIAPGTCGCGVADADGDADGVADCEDGCPADGAKLDPGACGCGVADTDGDADGVADCEDGCPADGAKLDPGRVRMRRGGCGW